MNKTRKVTFIALLSALAIVFTFLSISYPFVPWLKFDLSESIILLTTTILGLPAAIIVSFIKTLIQLFIGDVSPFNIGEITALIAALSFAITFYCTKKLNLVLRLVIVTLTFTFVMVVLNFFVSTPIYFTQTLNYHNVIEMGTETNVFGIHIVVDDTLSYLKMILLMYVPFNLMKATVISTLYILVEKPVTRAFELITNK